MRSTASLIAAIALASTALACGSSTTPNEDPVTGEAPGTLLRSDTPRDATPDISDEAFHGFIEDNAALVSDLYAEIIEEPAMVGGNVFFSPVSISLALAMTYAGARGTTEAEMATALHFELPQTEIHAALNRVDLELASRGEGAAGTEGTPFRINIANSLWGQDGYPFVDEYLDVLAVNYGAGVRLVDFVNNTENVRDAINGWVEQKTEDKIKDLIPEGVLTKSTRFVLTNAIYFDAAWASPFKKERTRDKDFHLADGSTISVPTMQDLKRANYAASGSHQVLELRYDGNELSMFVVLPSPGGLADTELAVSDGPTLQGMLTGLEQKSVQLAFPKFSFTKSVGLVEAFKRLGMNEVFSGNADLSGFDGTGGLLVSDIVHKAFVAVDEEGTKAAAATAVVGEATSAPEIDVVLNIDRPFIFVIRDNPTGAILFVGRVMNPAE